MSPEHRLLLHLRDRPHFDEPAPAARDEQAGGGVGGEGASGDGPLIPVFTAETKSLLSVNQERETAFSFYGNAYKAHGSVRSEHL
jgi:hypothetical protein